MDDVAKIVNEIKAGKVSPIYFLMGEEPYYIDKIAEYIENNILTEDERGFNQTIMYGRDVSIEDIVSTAKRYPMMAERQVVIVKEAQNLTKTIDQIEKYAQNPMPSTVLVFCYKYKTIDRRKAFTKAIAKNGVLYESKKLYENQIEDWIKRVLAGKGFKIDGKAAAMLVEFLGTDMGKISNEIEKLQIILPAGSTITPKAIEDNIGFSKDFNNFELVRAIGERNQLKAYKIAHNFAENQKDNPLVVTTSIVFRFFVQLLQYHGLKDRSPKNVSERLGIRTFLVPQFNEALKHYPMKKTSYIVAELRKIDIKGKGVGATSLSHGDLLKEMLIHIFD